MSISSRAGSVFKNGQRWIVLGALVSIIGFSTFVRLRLVDLPLERDEGEYAYTGQLMLQGIPPYKLAYNMKLPGTFAAYAVMMSLFGQTTRGIHFGLMVVNAATIGLTYLLGRRLFGTICALTAAASFALLSLSYSVLGLAAHATHFVTFFAIAGALLLWRALDKDQTRFIFWSALLFGLALLMKQQGIFFGAFGGVILLWHELRRHPRKLRSLFVRVAIFFFGMFLPFGLTCGALALAGVFPKFWFWTYSYARQYATLISWSLAWINLKTTLELLRTAAPGFWLLAGLGLVLFIAREKNRTRLFFILALLAAGLAAACPGLYFREHYFIPLLPVVGIFVGFAVETLGKEIARRDWTRIWLVVPCALFLLVAADLVTRHRGLFFKLSPVAAAHAIYGDNPFPEAIEIARYIREHSAPDSRIAVIGSEPEIYFYSQRHSVTGYIYTYPLVELQEYGAIMQRDMIAEIEANKPEFVVMVDVSSSWLAREGSSTLIFDWFKKYGAANLQTVGLVDIFADHPPLYRWGDKAVAVAPRSASFIRIFKRRDAF